VTGHPELGAEIKKSKRKHYNIKKNRYFPTPKTNQIKIRNYIN
jgi:hypothetical protein